MINLAITAEEADLIASLIRPRALLLSELHAVQVQDCPEGCTDWADTADALSVANNALAKVHWAMAQENGNA